MRRLALWLFFGDSALQRLARLGSVGGSLFGLYTLSDRFFPGLLPSGGSGIAIYVLLVLSGFLALELLNLHQDVQAVAPTGDPRADFAESLVRYARSLAESNPPRDQVLLELRRWTSRLLHLNGSHEARAVIGRLALGAAASLNDTFTEASILIDDLGWGLYEQGEAGAAERNIRDGVALLNSMPEQERLRPEVIELALKGRRHLIGIEYYRDGDIETAIRAIDELKSDGAALPEPNLTIHVAQLDYLLAALLNRLIKSKVGAEGRIDPTGSLHRYYERALECCRAAEAAFREVGDVERQVKAQKMCVVLLRHGGPSTRLDSAESRLRRLETVASRQLT